MKSEERPWLMERRAFLRLGAGFGLTTMLMGWANPTKLEVIARAQAGSTVTPRSTARNCIFIVLRGGPSHIDTFDLKVGSWTPKKLNPTKLSTGYLWPVGLMPGLAARANQFSLLRALQHQEVVHERAQYFIETGRRLNAAQRPEIPHIGAVIALELAEQRRTVDVLPSFLNFNPYPYTLSSNGFIAPEHAPYRLAEPAMGIKNLVPNDGLSAYDRRRATMQLLDGLETHQTQPSYNQLSTVQSQAELLMKDPVIKDTFNVTPEDEQRYGDNYFGMSLAVARNVLKADRGTRFIEVDHYDWDHHGNIYEDDNLPLLCNELDKGLSALFDDLAAAPGSASNRTLLDETLVVVVGEFGRTVGELKKAGGRDHYPYIFSALMAGGGVKGGNAIGATDPTGGGLDDFGWNVPRPMHMPDLVATIYSALGIDWTKMTTNSLSGRPFRYTEPQLIGDDESFEISPLF